MGITCSEPSPSGVPPQPGTVFAVWQRTGETNGIGYVYDSELDEDRQFLSINVGRGTIQTGGAVYTPPSTWENYYTGGDEVADPGMDAWIVSSVSSTTGVTDTVRLNGQEVYSGDLLSGGMDGLVVGCWVIPTRNYWEGDIAELIVFEGELTADERQQIEQVLMDRWAVVSAIPGDLNGDGFVGGDDLDIVRANWGQGTPPAPSAVPEPAAVVMLVLGALLLWWKRRV